MNGDVQYYLATLAFNNGEQLEDSHVNILRLQQEIMISGESFSPTRLMFQYMKALSNIDKPISSIAPKMTYISTFLDNNGKSSVYTGGYLYGIYRYLDMIRTPNILTTSGWKSLSSFQHFVFHKHWCSNSLVSYCSSPHKTEEYFWILWKNWTQSWCLHHPWYKIPPTKS